VSFSGLSALLILYLSSRLLRDGRREARYLLLAAVLVLLTRIFAALFSLDLLPGALGVNVVHLQRWLPLAVTLMMQIALAVRLQEANKARRQDAQRALLVERDRLRQEVQDHEVRWTSAAEALGEGFWEWDITSGEMLRSRVFDAALGYGEQGLPMTADAWVELIHPDDLTTNAACLQNYLTGKSATYNIEMRLRTKDGSYRWIACRGTTISRDAIGAPTRMIGMHTDISKRKQIEVARDSALDLLKNIASRVPGMVYQYHLRLDGSSYFPYASDAIRDIYRVTPKQASENSAAVFAAIHPEDYDAVVISIQQSAADQAPWLQEYRVKFDDGTVRWLLGTALPQRQADGGTLWHGFITDITERRTAEAALAEKSQLLVTVLANSSVGIIFIRDRLQVWSNPRMGQMFGFTLAELENQSPGLIYPSPESREKFVRIAYPSLARDGHFNTPWEMRRKDGSLLWVSLSGTSVDRNNPGAGSIWVVEDISKQRQTEQDLVVANDELTFQNEEKGKRAAELVVANDELTFQNEEKGKRAAELTTARDEAESANLAKSRFLATMSHEIRTPMNAVLGMAQVLLQPNIAEADRLDYARTIFNSGQTLLALLNDILDLSKIESGNVDLETIELEPKQLIHETQSLFAQTANAKGLTIDVRWRGPARRYLGDPTRLRQMLSNLVSNAIKFTKQGAICIEAHEVTCAGQTATLEFAVRDSGIGIAKDKQGLLFQTFSQADSSTTRNYGGTGLGLSIVRTLAQAMGGQAGVESEAGVGSRFWFSVRLDLAPTMEPVALAHAPGSAEVDARVPATLLRGRVLVIEDNLVNQEVIQVLLNQIGLDVALADNGQQAIDALMGGARAQLILTDLQMPVIDGYTTAQRIRQWEAQTQQKRHPIIALSADAFAGVRARCLAAGMDDVLSKPVLLGALGAALAEWLPVAPVDAQSAPTQAVQRAVDPAAIIALVNEILPLLAHGKADAIGHFKALQELVAGSELAPQMAEVGLPLKEFHFDLTLDRLREMASKYEWKTAP
jgi:PAS domain S-box-containing protein